MAWRRSPRSGLLLPRQRRPFNEGAPLSRGLRSLWVPSLALTDAGIENLVPDDPALLAFGGSSTRPVPTSTDFGPGLSFDGTDDYLNRSVVRFIPNNNFATTIAIACVFPSLPSSGTVYSFSSTNAGFTLELDVEPGLTRLVFTGDGNTTQTFCDIPANPTPGQVVLITGVLDDFTTARLSFYEPATGILQSATETSGTTTSLAASNAFDYETIGGWFGGGVPGYYQPMVLLDAWFWNRALSDDEIQTWRWDRWSVLAAPLKRTRATTLSASAAVASQAATLVLPAQTATLARVASAKQGAVAFGSAFLDSSTIRLDTTVIQLDGSGAAALGAATLDSSAIRLDTTVIRLDGGGAGAAYVLPLPTQTTSISQSGVIQQARLLDRPTQEATVRITAQGRQGELGTASGATLDSATILLDTDGLRLDGATPGAGQALVAPSQTAHAQAAPSGLNAQQALPAPSQTAAVEAAATGQQSRALPLPAQSATSSAPNPSSSSLSADQFLPQLTQSAAAAVRVAGQSAAALVRPAQAATAAAAAPPSSTLAQAKILLPPSQVARVVPFVPPVVIGPRPDDAPVVEPEILAATGDVADMVARQASVLPPWFGAPGTVPPVLRLPLTMAASAGSWLYDLIGYAKLQTRIRTATGGWLDLIADDFFGSRIRRRAGQGDESFRKRILVEMFRPRATRPAMTSVLKDLTGYTPRIFEPSRPQDVGGIGVGGGMGIGVSGAIGSIGLPGEVFITAYRDPDFGIPFAAGIGASTGGIGVPSRLVVSNLDQITGAVRDEDVYAAVEATRPVGIRCWVRIALGERTQA